MMVMKVVTIIIGSKIVSVNQVLITICINPVVRVKQNSILKTLPEG